jgi:hypothetical protein
MRNSVKIDKNIKRDREIFQLAEMLSIFSRTHRIISSYDIVTQMGGHRTTRYAILARAEVLGLVEPR